jgi:hypothetical protein
MRLERAEKTGKDVRGNLFVFLGKRKNADKRPS